VYNTYYEEHNFTQLLVKRPNDWTVQSMGAGVWPKGF